MQQNALLDIDSTELCCRFFLPKPLVVLAKPSVPVKPLGGCPKPSVVLGCHALSGRQALGRWLRSSWREPGGAKFVLAKLLCGLAKFVLAELFCGLRSSWWLPSSW